MHSFSKLLSYAGAVKKNNNKKHSQTHIHTYRQLKVPSSPNMHVFGLWEETCEPLWKRHREKSQKGSSQMLNSNPFQAFYCEMSVIERLNPTFVAMWNYFNLIFFSKLDLLQLHCVPFCVYSYFFHLSFCRLPIAISATEGSHHTAAAARWKEPQFSALNSQY